MDFPHIPIKIADLEMPLFAAEELAIEGDVLDLLLAKLPLLKSVFDAETLELKALIQDLGPGFADSPIFKDRAEGKSPLHYQGFLSVLNGIYSDPKNGYHATLTRFMEEHRFLMTELLAKALLDKEVHEASGGQRLPDAAHSLAELKSQVQTESALSRIIDQLLGQIQSGKMALYSDLKEWVVQQVLENRPYIKYPDLSPSDIRSLLTTLGMEEEALPAKTVSERVYEKAAALLKDPSTPASVKEFVEQVLLPRLESGTLAEGKEPVQPSFEEALSACLNLAQESEVRPFLQTALSPGEFPIIVPYTPPPPLASRRARWRLRKPASYFNASSMPFDEDADDGEEPTESRRELSERAD